MDRHHTKASRRSLGIALGLLLLVAGALAWRWSTNRPRLSPESYDVMTALYRVCNQQSEAGLTMIEQTIDDLQADQEQADPSIDNIEVIIEKARSGAWREAMRDAHRALEDQVRK